MQNNDMHKLNDALAVLGFKAVQLHITWLSQQPNPFLCMWLCTVLPAMQDISEKGSSWYNEYYKSVYVRLPYLVNLTDTVFPLDPSWLFSTSHSRQCPGTLPAGFFHCSSSCAAEPVCRRTPSAVFSFTAFTWKQGGTDYRSSRGSRKFKIKTWEQ